MKKVFVSFLSFFAAVILTAYSEPSTVSTSPQKILYQQDNKICIADTGEELSAEGMEQVSTFLTAYHSGREYDEPDLSAIFQVPEKNGR